MSKAAVWIIRFQQAPRGKIHKNFIWCRYHNGVESMLTGCGNNERAIKIAKEWCDRLGIPQVVEIIEPPRSAS